MEAFPAFFPLKGRRVVLAGEGEAAEAKARLLAGSPARLDRPSAEAALRPKTYAGAALAFVASPDADFRQAAAAAAREAGAPVNVTDHPELSDFHTPAIVDRGQVVAAIGSAGAAPALVALVRAELEARLPPEMGALAGLLGELRAEIRAAFPSLAQRRVFFRAALAGPAAEAIRGGDVDEARRRLRAEIAAGLSSASVVWLIETPAGRDLISLAAARALAEADLVVSDEEVDPDVLVLARRDAPRKSLKDTDAKTLGELAGAGTSAAVIAAPGPLNALAAELIALGIKVVRLASAPTR
jgi:siroheme synthase-like protein